MYKTVTNWAEIYPQRPDRSASAWSRFGRAVYGAFTGAVAPHAPNGRMPAIVRERQGRLRGLSDAGLRAEANELRVSLRLAKPNGKSRRELEASSFALVREAARRAVGMEHFDTQLLAAGALLRGRIVEMQTGEGKTLAATLAAGTQALAGTPVHVITANDYLAARDAAEMKTLYSLLGLDVGVVTSSVASPARRRAYACDVTYCCNKEVVFDYLRDRCRLGARSPAQLQFDRLAGWRRRESAPLLRGLHSAIVDEADSVLIDETRTPLILSRREEGERGGALETTALELAASLLPQRDYVSTPLQRTVELTDAGRVRLGAAASTLDGVWARVRWREQFVSQAIAALALYHRDRDYLVRDDQVQLIDEHTGRITPGRAWSQGLQQLIEAKEGVTVTHEPETLARISYQRFFRRYWRLAGMTGTAREAARELWSVYGLRVAAIEPHRPSRRVQLPEHVFARADEKWKHVVERIAAVHAAGQPVLVGTASVAASERLSELLTTTGLTHAVLNARQDHAEADIVASAGEQGRITVATNMAGRGTDIRLGKGVADLGGLHIIVTERHDAARIDRQLIGRCARQGDPGSFEFALSLDDPMLERSGGVLGRALVREFVVRTLGFGSRPAAMLLRSAQRRTQRSYARLRMRLLRSDHRSDDRLAFAGPAE